MALTRRDFTRLALASGLSTLFPWAAPGESHSGATAGGQERRVTLRDAARGRFLIGAAIRSTQLDQPKAAALIREQFDCLTAEFEFMPLFLQPKPGIFQFETADRIAAFARAHGLPLTGHMLCWHQVTPAWMFEDAHHKPLPREVALRNLRSHISTVVTHFRGRIESWNVVNEAIGDDPGEYLRDTPALRAIGPDYVQKAFEFAHAADPTVPLYYNEYNVEDPTKLPKVLRLIRGLKSAGVRLDAVGIQGHWLLDYPSAGIIEAGIAALGQEGLKVLVTELDVDVVPRDAAGDPYKSDLPAAIQEREAQRYASLFRIFIKHSDLIPHVTFWGLEDGQSWLNTNPTRRTNYPLLFDRNLAPKPAYDAVIDVLSEK